MPCRAHAAVLSPAMVQELVKVTQVAPSALTSTANTVAQGSSSRFISTIACLSN